MEINEDSKGIFLLNKAYKRLSVFLVIELFLIISIFFVIPFIERVTKPAGLEGFDGLGRSLWYASVSLGVGGILYVISIISLVVLYKQGKNVKKAHTQINNSGALFLRFKKISNILKTLSVIIVAIISAFIIRFEIGKQISEKESFEKGRPVAQASLKLEGEKIRNKLTQFKELIVSSQKNIFVGYGSVTNNGVCYVGLTEDRDSYVDDPPSRIFDKANEGSLFNPGKNFTPKHVIDPEGIKMFFVYMRDSAMPPSLLNQANEARCFSNQEHFAYQVPSFYEEQYPKFYCVDDVYPDVQVRDKRINGPSCDDLDLSYNAPSTRPVPDTRFYKNYKIQGLE